jgi:hypothetical protein
MIKETHFCSTWYFKEIEKNSTQIDICCCISVEDNIKKAVDIVHLKTNKADLTFFELYELTAIRRFLKKEGIQ